MSLEAQAQEEQFDLALLNSLEIDVVSRIGDSNVPDDLIVQLGKTLQIASRIHDLDLQREAASSNFSSPRSSIASHPETNGKAAKSKTHGRSESKDFKPAGKVNGHVDIPDGGTSTGKLLPRERFSYWCFDLLFLICSDVVKGRIKVGSDKGGFMSLTGFLHLRTRRATEACGGSGSAIVVVPVPFCACELRGGCEVEGQSAVP